MHLECCYCAKGLDKPWNANGTRARLHLSGEGQGVVAGKQVPEDIRSLFKSSSGATVAKNSRSQATPVVVSQPLLAPQQYGEAKAAEAWCI